MSTMLRLLSLFCLATVTSLFAQVSARTGIVTGQVLNENTGDVLGSAFVRAEGANVSTTADADGNFRLVLPEGAQTLVVSYSGLDDQKVDIYVTPGQETKRDVALTSALYRMDKFVVKTIREGQAAAIHEERSAVNVKNVAAIDAFGNPGAAVGELIMRLSGISVDGSGGKVDAIYIRGMSQDFSSLLMDGNQIAVSGGTAVSLGNVYFGQVSSGSVASLEVIKAPTPDMDGNAISGYLNLRTKRAFDRAPGRHITLTTGYSYTEDYQHKSVPFTNPLELYLLDVNYSDVLSVFGRKNNLGVSVTFNYTIPNHIINEIGHRTAASNTDAYYVGVPAAGQPIQPLLRAAGAGQWGNLGTATPNINVAASVDYKLGESSSVYFKSTYNLIKRRSGSNNSYFRWKATAPRAAASFKPGSTFDLVDIADGQGTIDTESVLYLRETRATTLAGGWEHKLWSGSGLIKVDTNYSKNMTYYPRLNQLGARMRGVAWQLDRADGDLMPVVKQTSGPDWSDPANYAIRPDAQLINYQAPAERWGGNIDLQKSFATKYPFTIKTGLKQSYFGQKQKRDLYYYTYAGQPNTPENGGITRFLGYNMLVSEGKYGPFPFVQLAETGNAGDPFANRSDWIQTSTDVWNTVYQSLANDAEFESTINAGYVMGDVRLGRLRVLTGIRYEETDSNGSNFLRVSNASNNVQAGLSADENASRARDNFRSWVTQGTKYDHVFPGLHFVYSFLPNLQLRSSYNATITRPSPLNLLPAIVPNELNQTLSAGNPALKPYTSDNYELSFAYYLSGIGQISAGAFYKDIKNYFRALRSVVPEGQDNGFAGDYVGWSLTRNENVGSAWIRGLEFNYTQQYTFLPGIWRGLGSFANYTYLETYGDYGAATGSTSRLPLLTPHTFNGGISFIYRGFVARFMANYRGEFFRSSVVGTYGPAGALPGSVVYDTYQHSRTLFDVKLQYSFKSKYVINVDLYNLSNDYTNNDYVHVYGRELFTYAAGSGTAYRIGFTARF
jgi:iron complex outermembrane recepter protein